METIQILLAFVACTLILKVLEKNFSFKVIELQIRQVWRLEQGCEFVDLEKGYLIVHFYCQEVYGKVLEGGPWMVLGHYLTVFKWRPNFSLCE